MPSIAAIASGVTAVTVIVTAIVKLLKLYDNMQQRYEDTMDLLNENTLLTYKIIILDENFALKDRIDACEKYLKMSENGIIRRLYERLLVEYENNKE